MRTRLGRVPTTMLVVMGLALPVSGCSDDREARPRPRQDTTAALSAPSPDSRATAQLRALGAYRGMWHAYAVAGTTANPDSRELARYAAGNALRALRKALQDNADRGVVSRGEPVLQPVVDQLKPEDRPLEVRIRDCIDTTNWLLYKENGEPVNDAPGGRRLVIATVKDVSSGVWKVTSFGAGEVGSCAK